MFTRVYQDDECLCEHIYADVAQILTNRITDNPSFLVLFFLQESKDEADSASGDIHLNDDDDDSSSVSGSEHSCLQAPVDSHTDVSQSESKSLL
jgi:hypothetical protein